MVCGAVVHEQIPYRRTAHGGDEVDGPPSKKFLGEEASGVEFVCPSGVERTVEKSFENRRDRTPPGWVEEYDMLGIHNLRLSAEEVGLQFLAYTVAVHQVRVECKLTYTKYADRVPHPLRCGDVCRLECGAEALIVGMAVDEKDLFHRS